MKRRKEPYNVSVAVDWYAVGVEAGTASRVGIDRAFSATFSAGAAAIDGWSDCFRADTAGGRSVAFVFVDGGDGLEHVEVGSI